jgi:hypothetical protein
MNIISNKQNINEHLKKLYDYKNNFSTTIHKEYIEDNDTTISKFHEEASTLIDNILSIKEALNSNYIKINFDNKNIYIKNDSNSKKSIPISSLNNVKTLEENPLLNDIKKILPIDKSGNISLISNRKEGYILFPSKSLLSKTKEKTTQIWGSLLKPTSSSGKAGNTSMHFLTVSKNGGNDKNELFLYKEDENNLINNFHNEKETKIIPSSYTKVIKKIKPLIFCSNQITKEEIFVELDSLDELYKTNEINEFLNDNNLEAKRLILENLSIYDCLLFNLKKINTSLKKDTSTFKDKTKEEKISKNELFLQSFNLIKEPINIFYDNSIKYLNNHILIGPFDKDTKSNESIFNAQKNLEQLTKKLFKDINTLLKEMENVLSENIKISNDNFSLETKNNKINNGKESKTISLEISNNFSFFNMLTTKEILDSLSIENVKEIDLFEHFNSYISLFLNKRIQLNNIENISIENSFKNNSKLINNLITQYFYESFLILKNTNIEDLNFIQLLNSNGNEEYSFNLSSFENKSNLQTNISNKIIKKIEFNSGEEELEKNRYQTLTLLRKKLKDSLNTIIDNGIFYTRTDFEYLLYKNIKELAESKRFFESELIGKYFYFEIDDDNLVSDKKNIKVFFRKQPCLEEKPVILHHFKRLNNNNDAIQNENKYDDSKYFSKRELEQKEITSSVSNSYYYNPKESIGTMFTNLGFNREFIMSLYDISLTIEKLKTDENIIEIEVYMEPILEKRNKNNKGGKIVGYADAIFNSLKNDNTREYLIKEYKAPVSKEISEKQIILAEEQLESYYLTSNFIAKSNSDKYPFLLKKELLFLTPESECFESFMNNTKIKNKNETDENNHIINQTTLKTQKQLTLF